MGVHVECFLLSGSGASSRLSTALGSWDILEHFGSCNGQQEGGGRNLVCPNNFDNSRHSGQEGCDVGAISSELSALEASWYFAMISIGNQGA